MDQQDQNRVSMWNAVYSTNNKHQEVWKDQGPFSRANDRLKDCIELVREAMQGQAEDSTGVTKDTTAYRTDAVMKVVFIAKCAKALALDKENHTLYEAVNYSKDTLLHLPQNELAATLESIVKAAGNEAEALEEYGAGQPRFDSARDAIAAFTTATPNTRIVISGRAGITVSIPVIMEKARRELTKMDNIVHVFEEEHPDYVAAFRASRVIVHSGQRHPNANKKQQ